jgi:hypothetical protein
MIMSKLPVMVFIAAILVASVTVLTVPSANALETRDFSYLNDNHLTALYGETAVCGDHMCAPGEWDKLQAALTAAQLGHQGGRTAPPTSTPSTSTAPAMNSTSTAPAMNSTSTAPATAPSATTVPTTAPASVCQAVQSTLNNAGVTPDVVTKVMSDLGCS